MIVFPAIDILDGKAVRLLQGRLDAVTVYNDDPVDQAHQWIAQGAEWLHVVDLDGAVTGDPKNIEVLERIVALGVPVQTGGGLRSMAVLERLAGVGVRRMVLGTALVTQPGLVTEACERFGGSIVAGIDARDGKVAINGWREGTEYGVLELVRELELLGVKRLAYTDISKDGMQTGVNYGAYRALGGQIDIPMTASGGVSNLDDIRDLHTIGKQLEGVIVGKALYENSFTLADAIQAGHGEEA
ncbi:MAG: 1-(5-phosphoribosyl)-5-[(5-phosphoribosylamino)methylideneamino]imidazole-4-carboxamide isomerase [Actinomycetota bacterium]|uniref:1-(5-phosphoribosyl)-5-[(5- phosphoribosylamino)methylideneamino]imidazole-4- carboxamide isomerase n=1 Tax=Bosea sp. (in: a-proteobacteria) TaxID=1871050 RepID=UPI001326A46B|nr:1-(5-phosphoribosyl)-5-[(5-phosphoribosylamino)methylideneamino]imidazole-4-carboxamide isomerase [Bosea sp. (in: a-proteobacteria)]KAF0208428.1 MAG: phosphoribosylformimino-5-aminoimidazole carboxamide ribotide [Actinomycetota bacterium]MDP3407220.1 1-(5-phosphoribosyl)-5-[(5-phosphoribosylamino)methylideneamino]imidazole-4-carboxamide isomerase [Bosea sp. (in: a-proteobacteria)]MDP3630450.1 1-(5-phosphoribosyl)-5-[(5-phosphoribosylamino)methylideneamino]imidazole-4-carboxamide isomerase [Ac